MCCTVEVAGAYVCRLACVAPAAMMEALSRLSAYKDRICRCMAGYLAFTTMTTVESCKGGAHPYRRWWGSGVVYSLFYRSLPVDGCFGCVCFWKGVRRTRERLVAL